MDVKRCFPVNLFKKWYGNIIANNLLRIYEKPLIREPSEAEKKIIGEDMQERSGWKNPTWESRVRCTSPPSL